MTERIGRFERETRETSLRVRADLDGGAVEVSTDLPFLDHMLSALACHGRIGLVLEGRGDVAVDPHHLVEDAGLALGTALARALAAGPPVRRAGCFLFPMDGSLAQCALDLCGRPNLVWRVPAGPGPLGGVDPRLFRDFFKAAADALRATIHVIVPYADGDHHALEAAFKAFGRAFADASRPVEGPPLSTKGVVDA